MSAVTDASLSLIHESTPPSSGSFADTYTEKTKLVTVPVSTHCQVLSAELAPGARLPKYWKYGWDGAVNVAVPDAFATATVPEPAVGVGPVKKKTRMLSAAGVAPS